MNCMFMRRGQPEKETKTITLIPSSYSTVRASVTNVANAYTNTSSTTYARIGITSSQTGYVFFGFDTSEIPDGATIESVTVKIKASKSSWVEDGDGLINVRLTAGGSESYMGYKDLSSQATIYTYSSSTLTLDKVRGCEAMVLLRDPDVSSSATVYFYGAELIVTYTY